MRTNFLKVEPYSPPSWTQGRLNHVPRERVSLGMLPTPVHRWMLPGLPPGVEVWVKRDDMSGNTLSGNKVRKLEFLMAEALRGGHDCVVTIGGIQSNHARATAAAARYLGLDCHLILRMGRTEVDQDPGLVGNLLVDRLVGAAIHKVTKEEYVKKGSKALCELLRSQLEAAGRRPYVIPVGGSNPLGTWGYLEAMEELREQGALLQEERGGPRSDRSLGQQPRPFFFTDIAMACGSGGTTAGIALGNHLIGLGARVSAFSVCDDPAYFHSFVDELVSGLGDGGRSSLPPSDQMLCVVQSKGDGYAISTLDELQTLKEVAEATGVILDPVYSGKAVHALLSEIRRDPSLWEGRRVLFWHTGGLLGTYDKMDQLLGVLVNRKGGGEGQAICRLKVD